MGTIFPRILTGFAALCVASAVSSAALAAGAAKHPHAPEIKDENGVVITEGWTFDGPFGKYDQAALQRGFQVYREVCSTCHGIRLLSFRNLGEPGGPFYDPEYQDPTQNPVVKAVASEYQVLAGPDEEGNTTDENGLPLTREAKPSDRFPEPYANEQAARAINGGALPPDLSLINKARLGGANYIYSLLIGYPEVPPEGLNVPPGQYYNPYYPGDTASIWTGPKEEAPPGGPFAMPPPLLIDEQVLYEDGTKATIEQMAYDVTHFLEWAAEPKMEVRKNMGLMTLGYLLVLTVLLYWCYRQVWRDVEH